jgi:hypothetical protein
LIGFDGDIEHPLGMVPTLSAKAGAAMATEPATSPTVARIVVNRLLFTLLHLLLLEEAAHQVVRHQSQRRPTANYQFTEQSSSRHF